MPNTLRLRGFLCILRRSRRFFRITSGDQCFHQIAWDLTWLVVSTPLKNIREIGSFPQVGVNIKKYFETTNQLLITDPLKEVGIELLDVLRSFSGGPWTVGSDRWSDFLGVITAGFSAGALVWAGEGVSIIQEISNRTH